VILSSRPLKWTISDIDEIMVYLGIVLAMHFLLRVSEYCKADGKNEEHAFRTNEVFFEFDGRTALTKSFEVNLIPLDYRVIGIHFRLNSSKTISEGKGITLFLSGNRSTFEVELIRDLRWWSLNAGLASDQLFFRRNFGGKGKSLTRSMVTERVKNLGSSIGLPAEGISTHSLRVSGACLMHRNGVPTEEIDRIGRWKPGSLTAVAYRAAVSVTNGSMNYGAVKSSLSDVNNTIRDVQIVSTTRGIRGNK
jgi:hypothetical protein